MSQNNKQFLGSVLWGQIITHWLCSFFNSPVYSPITYLCFYVSLNFLALCTLQIAFSIFASISFHLWQLMLLTLLIYWLQLLIMDGEYLSMNSNLWIVEVNIMSAENCFYAWCFFWSNWQLSREGIWSHKAFLYIIHSYTPTAQLYSAH